MTVTIIALAWGFVALAFTAWAVGRSSGRSRGDVEGYHDGWEGARKFYGVEDALEDELQEIIDSEGGAV